MKYVDYRQVTWKFGLAKFIAITLLLLKEDVSLQPSHLHVVSHSKSYVHVECKLINIAKESPKETAKSLQLNQMLTPSAW